MMCPRRSKAVPCLQREVNPYSNRDTLDSLLGHLLLDCFE